MRGMELLVIAGLLGLVAVGVWNARRWLPESAFPRTYVPTASVAVPEKAKPKSVRRSEGRRSYGSVPSAVSAKLDAGNLPYTVVDVPVGAPFPTTKDIPIGGLGVQIISKFGEPTVRTSAMDNGRLFERYYYLSSDKSKLTLATLEHGVVIAVSGP